MFLIAFTFFLTQNTLAVNISYVIKSEDDKTLGSLVVDRKVTDGKEEILVKSEIKVKKLVTVVISYSLRSVFVKNRLESNDIIVFRNHLPRDVMSTQKEAQGYLFTKNSEESKVKDFSFCESMMYFNEPKDQPEIYSEFDGVFKSIEYHKNENRYDLKNPKNKNISKYFYVNGMLQKAIVHHQLMTIFLYRK